MKKKILISSGGSGGHVIPAQIFFDHLKGQFQIFLTSDMRGKKFLNLNNYSLTIIDTPQITKNLFLLPIKFLLLLYALIKSIFYLKINKIDILISTGGYMSLPLCVAAKFLGKKIFLFEPNLVLGRANKFFLPICKKIFCYSHKIINFPEKYKRKIQLINPLLRKNFYSSKYNYNKIIEDKVNLLIIGGSQGAKLFDTKLKISIISLSKKYNIKIFQQTNFSNYKKLKDFYTKNNIENELFDFKTDIQNTISKANICVTRAGASTLSELIFLNIPSLAIPYTFAKDNHQYENALFYKNKNCCWMLKEEELINDNLTSSLVNIIENKDEYLNKKKNMQKFSYQNTWININEKLINTINEN